GAEGRRYHAQLRAADRGDAPAGRLRHHRDRSRGGGLQAGRTTRPLDRRHAARVAQGGLPRVKVAVVGTGYVGLVVGACLAETGNEVVCADLDAAKMTSLKRNKLAIYALGLEWMTPSNIRMQRLAMR